MSLIANVIGLSTMLICKYHFTMITHLYSSIIYDTCTPSTLYCLGIYLFARVIPLFALLQKFDMWMEDQSFIRSFQLLMGVILFIFWYPCKENVWLFITFFIAFPLLPKLWIFQILLVCVCIRTANFLMENVSLINRILYPYGYLSNQSSGGSSCLSSSPTITSSPSSFQREEVEQCTASADMMFKKWCDTCCTSKNSFTDGLDDILEGPEINNLEHWLFDNLKIGMYDCNPTLFEQYLKETKKYLVVVKRIKKILFQEKSTDTVNKRKTKIPQANNTPNRRWQKQIQSTSSFQTKYSFSPKHWISQVHNSAKFHR
ncbi:hypothetical protein RFI_10480 [Reticulomyxa filosa]|uniref:Uncharacterized protein n=1 Tax=Reticulomyxa filosa TaxID=46433 RepID=X6NK13_RETFI|nr:hypothetical protein RFI_10480 [Reticulomyxa filosa]|eukprot:ETO26650.1 hypothetical protein RFI_10480 [Reticulomyxa filosa]